MRRRQHAAVDAPHAAADDGPPTAEPPPVNVRVMERAPTLLEAVVAFAVLALAIVAFALLNNGVAKRPKTVDGLPFVSERELLAHDGWVALLGVAYDVGERFDGPGECRGRDCSAAFALDRWEPADGAHLAQIEREPRLVIALLRRAAAYDAVHTRVAYVEGPFFTKRGLPTSLRSRLLAAGR